MLTLPSVLLGFSLMVGFVVFGVWYNKRRDAALRQVMADFAKQHGYEWDGSVPRTAHFDVLVNVIGKRWADCAFVMSRTGPRWAVFVSRMTYSSQHGDGGEALCIIAVLQEGRLPDTQLQVDQRVAQLVKRFRAEHHPLATIVSGLAQDRYLRQGSLFWDEQVVYFFRYPHFIFRERTYQSIFEVFSSCRG